MDFDFKKARKNKQKQDKARVAHRHHPDQKSKNPSTEAKPRTPNEPGGAKGHATPLQNTEKPTSYTETDPMQFQHLKRETEDIAALTEPKSFSRRVIVSNWERYELPPNVVEDQVEEALDFETLIQSLSDVRGHLKLKHEQSWGTERSELQEDFFNMDMHKLITSLERVPYHIRQSLPATLFTQEQLTVFEQDADEARKQSCFAKSAPKEDFLRQNLLSSLTAKADDIKPTESVPNDKPVVALETKISSENETLRESHPPITVETKSSESVRATNLPEETPNTASSKSDELDLEYLLSLDSAAVEKSNVPQQVETLAMAVATSSKVPEAGKLDDWLDDLLDD